MRYVKGSSNSFETSKVYLETNEPPLRNVTFKQSQQSHVQRRSKPKRGGHPTLYYEVYEYVEREETNTTIRSYGNFGNQPRAHTGS